MRLFGRNRPTTTTNSIEHYDVTKLRSLYASLIEAIRPEHDDYYDTFFSASSSSSSFSPKSNAIRLGKTTPSSSSFDDEDEDDDGDVGGTNGSSNNRAKPYSIRHFRRSSSSTTRLSKHHHDDVDDDDGETTTVQFDDWHVPQTTTFQSHPSSKTNTTNTTDNQIVSNTSPHSWTSRRRAKIMNDAWLRLSATVTERNARTIRFRPPITTTTTTSTTDSSSETGGGTATTIDGFEATEEDITALLRARRIESRVVELIRSIGEIVVYGEQRNGDEDNNDQSGRWRQRKKGGVKDTSGVSSYDAVFEYFCDKNMLSLLVDMATSKPPYRSPSPSEYHSSSSTLPPKERFSGVVYTSLIKSQILQTVSILVSNVQDPRSLYYLLSNNYINELVGSLVPLHRQFTPGAVEEILPVYICFLKTLAMRLAGNPGLFSFFSDGSSGSSSGGRSGMLPTFPLFYAAVDVASSPVTNWKEEVGLEQGGLDTPPDSKSDHCGDEEGGTTSKVQPTNTNTTTTRIVCTTTPPTDDCFVHTTALNIILNLCRLPHPDLRSVVSQSFTEQRILVSNLCQRLTDRYDVIARTLMGRRVADDMDDGTGSGVVGVGGGKRIERLEGELGRLEDGLCFVNDLLWCRVDSLNVRLCECLMKYVVTGPLMENLLPPPLSPSREEDGSNDDGGGGGSETGGGNTIDNNNEMFIGEDEAYAQTSAYFLAQIFMTIDYPPLLRMVAVALLHPYSPSFLLEDEEDEEEKEEGGKEGKTNGKEAGNGVRRRREQRITPALEAIVRNRYRVIDDDLSYGDGDDDTEGKSKTEKEEDLVTVSSNPYRSILLSLLGGELGNARFVTAAVLFESILERLPPHPSAVEADADAAVAVNGSEVEEGTGRVDGTEGRNIGAIDSETLRILELFPSYGWSSSSPSSPSSSDTADDYGDGVDAFRFSSFERSLGRFFRTFQNPSSSAVGFLAAEMAFSTTVRYLNYHFMRALASPFDGVGADGVVDGVGETGTTSSSWATTWGFGDRFRRSPLVRGILDCKKRFAKECRAAISTTGVDDDGDNNRKTISKTAASIRNMVPNLMETHVGALYEPVRRGKRTLPIYDLRKDCAASRKNDPLVLSLLPRRDLEPNEVCDARSALGMVLRLGVLSEVLEEVHDRTMAAAGADGGGEGGLIRSGMGGVMGGDGRESLTLGASSRWWDLQEDERQSQEEGIGSGSVGGDTGGESFGIGRSGWDGKAFRLRTFCPATEDVVAMGGLAEPPTVGSDRNLRDRTYFFFSPSLNMTDARDKKIDLSDLDIVTGGAKSNGGAGGGVDGSDGLIGDTDVSTITEKDRRRKIADVILTRATSKTEMVTLVEGEYLFVLKPKFKSTGEERGTILCSTKLRNVLGTATDGEWLHVAMREVDDVGVLIKKGNMALRFDSLNTCLAMKENLEKGQAASHEAVLGYVERFLQRCLVDGSLSVNDDELVD